VNGYQQGFRSVTSFGFGGQESASKPPQAICKTLGIIMIKQKIQVVIILFSILSISVNAQCTIKGKLIDRYGKNGWFDYKINGEKSSWPIEDGNFEFSDLKNGLNEIEFFGFGYLPFKIICNCNNEVIDLKEVYLISSTFWLDGPKNGIIINRYDNGNIKDSIFIKRFSLRDAKFYNEQDILTQEITWGKGKKNKVLVYRNGEMVKLNISLVNGQLIYNLQDWNK